MLDYPLWKKLLVLAICAWAVLYTAVNFQAPDKGFISQRINLGLDLKGGSYLMLELGTDSYLKEQLQNMLEEVRIALRKEHLGYQNLRVEGEAISLKLREADDEDKIVSALRSLSRDWNIEVNQDVVHMTFYPEYRKQLLKKILEQSIEIVRRRVDQTGTREPIIQRQGENRILLQVPGLKDTESLKRLLGTTAKMTFHLMDESEPFPAAQRAVGSENLLLKGEKDRFFNIKRTSILGGDMLTDAQAGFDQSSQPVVNFRFNSIGAKKFADVTKENTGKPFAIVLDNHVITAPRINEPILGGSGMISGSFTTESANELALLLRAGALPAPLTVVEERSVGPSLGQDSIDSGKKAAFLGIALVMFFMFATYLMFGIFANIALVINLTLVVACLTLFGATLTMPGIAGMVLTLGMSVDANVLIFERIREEIRNGRSPLAAVDHGFQKAYSTIMDSNVTGLISAFLLYMFGSGPIKGFAVTLSIGIVTSMFSAIMLTRMLIVIYLRQAKPKTIRI